MADWVMRWSGRLAERGSGPISIPNHSMVFIERKHEKMFEFDIWKLYYSDWFMF